jgi:hypothetical protein
LAGQPSRKINKPEGLKWAKTKRGAKQKKLLAARLEKNKNTLKQRIV